MVADAITSAFNCGKCVRPCSANVAEHVKDSLIKVKIIVLKLKIYDLLIIFYPTHTDWKRYAHWNLSTARKKDQNIFGSNSFSGIFFLCWKNSIKKIQSIWLRFKNISYISVPSIELHYLQFSTHLVDLPTYTRCYYQCVYLREICQSGFVLNRLIR